MLYSRSLCFFYLIYVYMLIPYSHFIPYFLFFFFWWLLIFWFRLTSIRSLGEARTMEKASGIAQPCAFYFQNYPARLTLLHLPRLPHLQFSSVQSLSRVRLFVTPWITARQASLSITNSRSLLILMSIESVMPSSHLILCCPLLLLPQTPPSIRVFSNESALHMRWPKYWSFSFSIILSNEHPGPIS